MHAGDYLFSEEDLDANRAGILTAAQEALIADIYNTRHRGAKKMIRPFILYFAALMVAGTIIELLQWKRPLQDFVEVNAPYLLMAVVAFFSILAFVNLVNYIIGIELRRPRVKHMDGVASVLVKEAYARGPYMRYELRLKRGFLRTALFRYTSEQAVRQFEEGRRYRVYFIPYYPRIVLSAEHQD